MSYDSQTGLIDEGIDFPVHLVWGEKSILSSKKIKNPKWSSQLWNSRVTNTAMRHDKRFKCFWLGQYTRLGKWSRWTEKKKKNGWAYKNEYQKFGSFVKNRVLVQLQLQERATQSSDRRGNDNATGDEGSTTDRTGLYIHRKGREIPKMKKIEQKEREREEERESHLNHALCKESCCFLSKRNSIDFDERDTWCNYKSICNSLNVFVLIGTPKLSKREREREREFEMNVQDKCE